MRSSTLLLLFAVICAAYAIPTDQSLVRAKRQLDFFGNTRQLVEELIQNLGKAAEEAQGAVVTFGEGLRAQARQCRERFLKELNSLRSRVNEAIETFGNRISESGGAVLTCVEGQRNKAEHLFEDAFAKAMNCAETRLATAEDLLKNLSNLAHDLEAYAKQAFAELSNCTEQNNNLLSMGACMGSVALQTEVKGAVLLTQSGLLIGRMNLYLASLPASLEFCAGTGLVSAGVGTARIVMDIGSCSASNALNILMNGNQPVAPNLESAAASVPLSPEALASSVSSAAGSVSSAISEGASSLPNAASSLFETATTNGNSAFSNILKPVNLV